MLPNGFWDIVVLIEVAEDGYFSAQCLTDSLYGLFTFVGSQTIDCFLHHSTVKGFKV